MKDLKMSLSSIPTQHQDIASFMGIKNFIEFCTMFGGSSIYFPSIKTLENYIRNDDVLDLYYKNKMTIKEIARRYNISDNYVRYIIKKNPYNL